jgi:chorismate dehydratase
MGLKENPKKDGQEFPGSLGNYQLVKTEDGSFTLHSEAFDENCHSLTGAREETIYHYITGCKLVETAQVKPQVSVLEIGFGLGIGYEESVRALSVKAPQAFLNFFSVEIDEALITIATNLSEFTCAHYPNFKDLTRHERDGLVYYQAKKTNASLTILIGNARETLPRAKQLGLLPLFDAIYQDAFSPRKNPILWTQQWFELLKQLSAPTVQLATYSSAQAVRKSMMLAGWGIHSELGFGPKRSCTRANLQSASDPELIKQVQGPNLLALKD